MGDRPFPFCRRAFRKHRSYWDQDLLTNMTDFQERGLSACAALASDRSFNRPNC